MSEEAGQMMVMYDDPSDQRSLSLDDTSSTEESPDETRLSLETTNDVVPYIGQRFATHDAAYEFYSELSVVASQSGGIAQKEKTGLAKGLQDAILFATVLETLLSKLQTKINLKETENPLGVDAKHTCG
ncbi:Protein FAR1-RELATED SEQUENCE 11 [Camellia lanceoleosa]|uniref:Protein FAR1-RELATED SEQUENCE 11 n=1 Tax=Camellia lanceoleosa TaxID=1840588 RepID=A0ACC0ISF6_9ERIC|nr:Protein FAR1-RELATED SEQUENCE 11 [Camellia lanceoleosa]